MRPISTVVVLPILLAISGCTKFSRTTRVPRVQPPPGTGQVETNLQGSWQVVEVRASGGLFSEPGGGLGGSMRLPGIGSRVTFDDKGFLSSDLQDLRREHLSVPDGSQITEYLNQSDGRFAIYILKLEPKPAVGGEQFDQIQMAFGTEDVDHLLGVVFFHVGPVGVTPARQGTFLVRLQRRR